MFGIAENAGRDSHFRPSFEEEYALAKRIGDQRFGSPCKHVQVKNGRCRRCLRKVR